MVADLSFNDFVVWEQSTRDIIDFKKTYCDVADGDVLAGLVLSEIIYWHLPSSKDGQSKMRIVRDDKEWIACRRYEWWDRTRLTPRQMDRVLSKLTKLGLIEKEVFKFYGDPTVHVRLVKDRFMKCWHNILNNPLVNPFLPNGENEITAEGNGSQPDGENDLTKNGKSLTETPTSSTSSNTTQKDISSPFGVNFMFHFLGQVLTAAADAIEQSQAVTPFEEFVNRHVDFESKKNPVQEAVAWVFKVKPGGFAGTLGSQLSGTATKGRRAEWNIAPGLDPLEIVAFGIWYNAIYEDKPPTTAETLYERALQFRDSYEYPEALNRANGVLAKLMDYPEQIEPEEGYATQEEIDAAEAALQELYGG